MMQVKLEDLKKHPQALGLIFVLLLPLILIAFQAFASYSKWSTAALEVEEVYLSILEQRQKNAMNQALSQKFQGKEPKFLEKEVEPFPLLTDERKRLTNHLETYTFISTAPLQERLKELETQNKLLFNEKGKTKYPRFLETTQTLAAPVEVDGDDLLELLALLEGSEKVQERPLIQITDFSLSRKESRQDQLSYQLMLKLVQRDFL